MAPNPGILSSGFLKSDIFFFLFIVAIRISPVLSFYQNKKMAGIMYAYMYHANHFLFSVSIKQQLRSL